MAEPHQESARFLSWVDALTEMTPEAVLVIRAIGDTSARLHISADAALALLSDTAQERGISVPDLAVDVLSRRLALSPECGIAPACSDGAEAQDP